MPMMQNRYRRTSSSIYERELVELLRGHGVYSLRAGASGAGKQSDADVFSDGGLLFEVKSITTKQKPGGWQFPYYSLTIKDRGQIERLKELCKTCDLLYFWGIRVKTPTRDRKATKWRFVAIDRLVHTSRGGVHADPRTGGLKLGEIVALAQSRKNPLRLLLS